MRNYRQHDVTDCGAACLAYVFDRHGLGVSLSALRQKAGTGRNGTTALGLVDTAKLYGFEAKGVRCSYDDLRSIPLPGIAHVLLEGGRQHFVVVCSIRKKDVRVMDPAVGRVQPWSIERFKACWTNVLIVLAPTVDFRPSAKTASAWSRLVSLLGPQKHVLFQAFVGVVLTTILSLASAVYIQKIVDHVIVDGNRNLLRLLGVGMLIILGLRVLIGYFQSVLMLRSAQRIDAALLLGYYRHLMRLPQSFFDTMRVGEITSRMRDAVAVREFLNGTILGLVLNPLILVVALGAMFAYSWKLALYSLALVPAYVAIYFASDWLNRRYQREIMERSADLDAQIVESLHSMSVVRSCGIEDEMSFRTETRLARVLKRVWSAGNAGFVIGGTGSFVTQAYTIGLLWVGASLVLRSELSAGALMSCNALAGYITGPIVAIIGMNASIRSATTATERLYEILDLELEQDDGTAELSLEGRFALQLDGVNFRYPGRLATLKDVSLRFDSGTVTALVGKSGCGKSTLLGMLQRHYIPDSGKIMIAGVDIQYVQLRTLRSRIAYVPQKIDLLAGTVLENIAPSEPHPDMPRIVSLCRDVGLLDFIEALPRGFQTLITENGANLSGGQRQRLAIVRALYADAPIVLMDEPSSALDAESEEMLTAAVREMRERGKLVILAVHNRRLLATCDHIVEMENGAVLRVRSGADANVALQAPERALGEPARACRHDGGPVDDGAIAGTLSLFSDLRDRRLGGTLFGQHDANIMGVDESGRGWFLDNNRCDIHSVTGKWPAIFGFVVGDLQNGWDARNAFVVPRLRDARARGGVAMASWWPEDFVTRQSPQSVCAVTEMLPGSRMHAELVNRLNLLADNLGRACDASGEPIPILLRCWARPNAGRHWWGGGRATPEEYRRLFRFTVTYLRDVRRIHNVLHVFCLGNRSGETSLDLDYYPGDEFVDVLGLDWFGNDADLPQLHSLTAEVAAFAEARRKPMGLCEVGYESGDGHRGIGYCDNPDWLDSRLISPLLSHSCGRRIAFLLMARNECRNPSVFHTPPVGHAAAAALQRLSEDQRLVFVPDGSAALGTAPNRISSPPVLV